MKRKKKKTKRQGCDVVKVIDTRRTGPFNGKEGLSGYRATGEPNHKSTEDKITAQTEPRS
jgi:hypothetical protein